MRRFCDSNGDWPAAQLRAPSLMSRWLDGHPRPPTLFTGNGMPRNLLMLVDSPTERTDAPDLLLKTCEATCGSYCLP
jgi:hypothetical protein